MCWEKWKVKRSKKRSRKRNYITSKHENTIIAHLKRLTKKQKISVTWTNYIISLKLLSSSFLDQYFTKHISLLLFVYILYRQKEKNQRKWTGEGEVEDGQGWGEEWEGGRRWWRDTGVGMVRWLGCDGSCYFNGQAFWSPFPFTPRTRLPWRRCWPLKKDTVMAELWNRVKNATIGVAPLTVLQTIKKRLWWRYSGRMKNTTIDVAPLTILQPIKKTLLWQGDGI